MPGPGTRGPQVTGVSCRRGLLRGTWSRHRGPRADRKVGLPAVRTGHLQWCFSPSRGSTPDPQPRHCSRRRCGFRDLGSAAPPVCDGHLDLGRPQRAPLWGPGSQNTRHRPGGRGAARLPPAGRPRECLRRRRPSSRPPASPSAGCAGALLQKRPGGGPL